MAVKSKLSIDMGCMAEEFNGAMNGICDKYETSLDLDTERGFLSLSWNGFIGEEILSLYRHIQMYALLKSVNPESIINIEIDKIKDEASRWVNEVI